MASSALRLWARTTCLNQRKAKTSCLLVLCSRRTYATHPQMDFGQKSKILSDSLDTKHHSESRHENVGPFQLGLSQSALRREKSPPKWSELSTAGKVKRTAARTTNLGVILLGAGLSALLVYSLTSELFSKNSPTVLYGDACERIKSSPKVARYLNAPLTFHNNPPSSQRPRHRNRHVPSRVVLDAQGQEHMIMTFYVQGRPEGEAPPSETSYFETLQEWTKETTAGLSELTLDDAIDWSKTNARGLWDSSVDLFKYLSGQRVSPPSIPTPLPTEAPARAKESSGWGFAGMFSSLRGPKSASTDSDRSPATKQFTDGEVHADFVKDKDGYFQFRYLLIDIPNSQDRSARRIFVEKAPGVRESEPVMRWVS